MPIFKMIRHESTEPKPRKTLAQWNENQEPHEWSGLVLKTEYSVGGMNIATMRAHVASGEKVHLLTGRRVLGYVSPDYVPPKNTVKIGDYFGVSALCNGNGQTGRPYPNLDTKDVNCKRCFPGSK